MHCPYDRSSRISYEHDNPEAQHEVALTQVTPENWAQYDTVYIAYPIWWGIAAWPVNGFITGKAVIPFCPSASSGLGQSGELLAGGQAFAHEESATGWLFGEHP